MLAKLKPLSLIIFIFAVGCAPKLRLVKDVTPEQLNKENAECRLEAQKATQLDWTGNLFIRADNINTAISNCLQAKGYTYQTEPDEKGKAVIEKYKQASIKFKEQTREDNNYIINNCRPKEDKEYISCLNEVNEKQVALHIFPELYKSFLNERKEYENILIRKEMTRLQFKDATEKLSKEFDSKVRERVNSDIKIGIYTGKQWPETKMSFFTYLWKNETWSKKAALSAKGYTELDYSASDKFNSAGISDGATVFIVTVKQGVLYLGGYIKVYAILDRSRAASYLSLPETELWKADEYIVAQRGTEIDFRDDLVIPTDKAKKLEFLRKGGFVNLKMDSDGKLDRQTLRNVRKLYLGSEKHLFDVLQN